MSGPEEGSLKIGEAKYGNPLIAGARCGEGNPMYGRTHSPESRLKMGAWQKGKPKSDEQRRQISETLRGRALSPEHREKLSAAGKGKTHSEETKRKIADALRGRVVSEETRRKLSEASKGRPMPPHIMARLIEINKAGVPWNKGVKTGPLPPEIKAKRCGENNPNWRGGVSYEPYCVKFNNEFKERVREFFGRVCVECGAPENGVRLSIHHVNFRKDSCCAEDVTPLFVPLCQACHGKTQGNREYWEARFTALINERYGGRCYLPKQDAVIGQEVPA